jgi:hypothetical protein
LNPLDSRQLPDFAARFIEIRRGLFWWIVYIRDMKEETFQAQPVYGPLPIPGLPVQVQCEGFKCMAYRNKDGRWVDFFTRQFLPRVLGVIRA